MNSIQTRRMTYAGLCLALAMVLPFLTGQIPEVGRMLSPMHIPAFLCGFLCGWPWGLAVGFVSPLLRSVIFGMPNLVPEAVAMAFEMAVYGVLTGLLYRIFPRKPWSIYVIMILSMLAGRVVWGVARLILSGITGSRFTWIMFMGGAFTSAIPAIILQIVLIPPLVIVMDKAGLTLGRKE